MTVQVDYTANGFTNVFYYPFALPSKGALEVRINDVIQDGGFLITGAGCPDGGSVVFASVPAEGRVITLRYLGGVTVTSNDAAFGHLADKLVAGTGVSLETVTEPGGMQRLKVSAAKATDALEKDQNLADLTDVVAARTNLGVYSKAETDARDQAVKDAALLKANNLSDLTDVAAAQSNLGVYSKSETNAKDQAVQDTALLKANNLSDLIDVAEARSNLGLTDVGGSPLGSILLHSGVTAPRGYLIANGVAVSRSTYTQLDAAIYVGDNANATAPAWYRCTDSSNPTGSRAVDGAYLVLPDYRGEFLRGLDLGRGLDLDGTNRMANSHQGDAIRNITGTAQLTAQAGCTGAFTSTSSGEGALGGYAAGSTLSFNASRVVPVASENRPCNAAVLICIKAN